MSTPKRHHYIPQGLLRNFAFDKNDKKIRYIDKRAGKPLSSSIKKVAREHFLYTFENNGPCIETSFFGDIDDLGIASIDKIVCGTSLNKLTSKEHSDIRRFVSAQILRVPDNRMRLENFEEDISMAFNGEYSTIKDGVQADFLNSIIKGVELYESLLSKKQVKVLSFKDPSENFIIGDVPVTQRNLNEKTHSQLGHSPAIPVVDWDCIALPISPKHLLMYHDNISNDEIVLLAQENNSWQFIQSNILVFAQSEDQLSSELKKHYENCYRYVEAIEPEYIRKHAIKYGDKIDIVRPRIAFTGRAREQMKNLLSQSMANKKN
jgi:hypothetical protein